MPFSLSLSTTPLALYIPLLLSLSLSLSFLSVRALSLSRVLLGASLQIHLSSATKMESFDFLQWLEIDMALKILMSLDDPSDLIRASGVSRFWHHFVITNGLCKQFCLRLFPQLSSVSYVPEPSWGTKKSVVVGSSEALEKEHRAYAFLGRALTTTTVSNLISCSVSASSTDNFPEETIHNTLDARDVVLRRASYWSSKGHKDPAVPETLVYKLIADLCVVTEISVQPFQAFFQPGHPIYSAQSVRFRLGHPRSPKDIENDLNSFPWQLPADDKFIWTYTSQEFPMAQENCLQKFKLPEPVLCIGGFVQIELLGRVQRQETDGLFYMCVCHVQVLGQALSPAFEVEIGGLPGKHGLKYYPESRNDPPPVSPCSQLATSATLLEGNFRGLEEYLNVVYGNVPDFDVFWDDDDNDMELVLM